jgi:hypothetical protein
MADRTFKGPGHWRSQAEKARGLDGNVFAELAEMHRRLTDKGMTEVAAEVARAMDKAKDGFVDDASDILRQAAQKLTEAPAHAHGLREIAERTASARPGTTTYADEGELPGGLGEPL